MKRDIMEIIIDKDRAMKKAKKTGIWDDFLTAKRMKNETGKLVEKAKSYFLENEFVTSKGDPKRFWKNIYSIIPNLKLENKNKHIIYLKNENGDNIEIDKSADYIKDFFTDIGPRLAEKCKDNWKFFGKEELNSIHKIEIHKGEVLLLIDEIDVSKSSGLDIISSKCLKDALLVLNDQLCYIFEKSIESSIYPDKWKIATVVPLFIGGVKEDISNYRPVSLLPVPGKILEKIVHDQMMSFLKNNDSLCEKQNGFRPNHSTINSIVDLTDDIFIIINNINNGIVTLSAFIDLKKAFDTVNHNILLEKLSYMGIKRNTISWIKINAI